MTDYIDNNFAGTIKIEDLAQAGHVSRTRVFELFKQYASMNPHDFILSYRLDKADALLVRTRLSVLEIAMMCGFKTSSYFSKVFRKEKGVTPREYRKNRRFN